MRFSLKGLERTRINPQARPDKLEAGPAEDVSLRFHGGRGWLARPHRRKGVLVQRVAKVQAPTPKGDVELVRAREIEEGVGKLCGRRQEEV